jgi:hypothetical protein
MTTCAHEGYKVHAHHHFVVRPAWVYTHWGVLSVHAPGRRPMHCIVPMHCASIHPCKEHGLGLLARAHVLGAWARAIMPELKFLGCFLSFFLFQRISLGLFGGFFSPFYLYPSDSVINLKSLK